MSNVIFETSVTEHISFVDKALERHVNRIDEHLAWNRLAVIGKKIGTEVDFQEEVTLEQLINAESVEVFGANYLQMQSEPENRDDRFWIGVKSWERLELRNIVGFYEMILIDGHIWTFAPNVLKLLGLGDWSHVVKVLKYIRNLQTAEDEHLAPIHSSFSKTA